ncbi:MAG TPA: alkaline phosphatase family protein [Bacteroidia bacterium]|nr:alkaline phosphatase family protein [Bacteroidia bacterium]HNS11199.1 alkaline phosphatase family protein [Bacteroidia bacterium]
METQKYYKRFLKRASKVYMLATVLFLSLFNISTFAAIPRPDHVVICVLENHGYPQVIGSSHAPYIDYLTTIGANLQEYYALTHPSQPNYIMMFSGSNQGVTDNNLPSGTPWSSPNLGASLLQAGFTFKGYSEDLPTTGSTVGASGAYARKHSPWVHWQGSGTNQIPSSCNVPFSDFPSDFNLLPDVSFVIPNQNNDMHNGSDPARIISGDEWVQQNLGAYISWAQNNNSLFILIFDEDNADYFNRVPCIFVGPMVEPGNYATIGHHHYNFLRTLEEMYALPFSGSSATSEAINEIWRINADVNTISEKALMVSISPNPLSPESKIFIENGENLKEINFELYNILGSKVFSERYLNFSTNLHFPLKPEDLSHGVYFYKIHSRGLDLANGKLIVN